MHRLLMVLFLIGSFSASAADTATGRVVKVLPLVLDLKGRAALSPSLFDRDAYQAYLRLHTNEISAVRFDVLWSTSHADRDGLKVRLELRGVGPDGLPRQTTLEQAGQPHFFRHWTSLTLWSTSHADRDGLKVRLELRGVGPDGLPRQTTLEQAGQPHFFRHWTSLTLGGEDLKRFGSVVAWRASLWSGDQRLAQEESFLW